MDENKKRVSIIVDDDASTEEGNSLSVREKIKKPLIIGLMTVAFLACMYLIFKPKGSTEEYQDNKLKNAVPEASDKGLLADKQKAYEKEIMEEQDALKRNSLTSLSDYWSNSDSISKKEPSSGVIQSAHIPSGNTGYQNRSLISYQDAQNTLGAFYRDDDREKLELRRKVDQLEEKLSTQEIPAAPTMKDQLALMEKSYEMASKYLPSVAQPPGITTSASEVDSTSKKTTGTLREKEKRLATVTNSKKELVSMLTRAKEGISATDWDAERNRTFITVGTKPQNQVIKNSIPAKVIETQTVSGDGNVKLRLQETALIGSYDIPKGNIVVAEAKYQGNRLQLKISSVEVGGNILPVEILVYDVDGQLGLSVPRSDEVNAAGELVANMTQGSGMNVSMSRSAGQQVAGDLSRGLMQGISGFFAKKLRTNKVTLKAGHQVFLVAKK